MRRGPGILAIGLSTLALAGAATTPAAAQPVLGFEARAVVVSAVPPGGEVALFGVGKGHNGFTGYVARWQEALADDDGDGAARLELAFALPWKSVWAAVELGSGELVLGAPEGFALREVAFPAGAIEADGRALRDSRRYVDVLWARPGHGPEAGVWGAAFGDGGANDGDGAEDGAIRAPASAFAPLAPGGSGPPDRFAPGDTVVVVDRESLEVYAARLAG
jgi:hypothetical protein